MGIGKKFGAIFTLISFNIAGSALLTACDQQKETVDQLALNPFADNSIAATTLSIESKSTISTITVTNKQGETFSADVGKF